MVIEGLKNIKATLGQSAHNRISFWPVTSLVRLHQLPAIRWRPKLSHPNHLALLHSLKPRGLLAAMLLWGLGKSQPGKYFTGVFQISNSLRVRLAGCSMEARLTVKCLTPNFSRLQRQCTTPLQRNLHHHLHIPPLIALWFTLLSNHPQRLNLSTSLVCSESLMNVNLNRQELIFFL